MLHTHRFPIFQGAEKALLSAEHNKRSWTQQQQSRTIDQTEISPLIQEEGATAQQTRVKVIAY